MTQNLQKEQKYEVTFDGAALRDIKKLPKKAADQVIDLSASLADNPRPEGVEQLTKFDRLYRVRTGNSRVVYQIQDDNKLVIIAAVADRKDIYKVLDKRFT